MVRLLDLLLAAPDLHDQLVGQQLDEADLEAGVFAVDGHVLALFHVADGLTDNARCFVHHVVV